MAKDKWPEGDGTEQRSQDIKNRKIAEGEGAGATKAAWVLGGVCVVLAGLFAWEKIDNRVISKLNDMQFVVIQKAKDGEILSATVASGELQTDTAVEQWVLADWIDKVRGVPLDPVAFNLSYFKAQQFMCSAVQARIDRTMKKDEADPSRLYPEAMIKQGITRRIHVQNVTPRGSASGSNSYRLDWTETLYRGSAIVGQSNATADVELRYFKPETAAKAANNPYGLYVCTFDSNSAPGS
jgi:type IV secretory pathway TrbF-like protein